MEADAPVVGDDVYRLPTYLSVHDDSADDPSSNDDDDDSDSFSPSSPRFALHVRLLWLSVALLLFASLFAFPASSPYPDALQPTALSHRHHSHHSTPKPKHPSPPPPATSDAPDGSSHLTHPLPPPPPPHSFDWCYDCPQRCSNILSAIAYHASFISHRDRSFKYKEIAASLPRFFRGLDHLYLQDVFNLGWDSRWWVHSSATTRPFILADMHMYNFGSFDNSRGELVYDMNDFDQTFIGDYHVDLWRTATSVVLHMNMNGILHQQDRERIMRSFARTYYDTVASFVGNDDELNAYISLSNNASRGAIRQQLLDSRASGNRERMLEEYTFFTSHNVRKFDLSRPDMEVVPPSRLAELELHWPDYLRTLGTCRRVGHNHSVDFPYVGAWVTAGVEREAYYKAKSVAGRIGAGLGSLGQPRYYVLVEGPTKAQSDDVMLDIKREPLPEWWNFVHEDVRAANSVFPSQGARICRAMHALETHVDLHVGYMDMSDGSYIVRSRSPWKGAVDVDAVLDVQTYQQFTDDLARITAINHCRADNDYNGELIPWSFEDALMDAVKNTTQFEEDIMDYGYMNAERIAEDFQCYIRSGLAESE